MTKEELIASYKAQGMPQDEIGSRLSKYIPDENGDYISALQKEGADEYNKKLIEENQRNRTSNNLKLGADIGLNTYKLANAANNIQTAKDQSAQLTGNIPNFQTLQDNPNLQGRLTQAQMDTTRGLSPTVRSYLYNKNLQAFQNQLRNNESTSGGQSGIANSLNQASTLDRIRGNNEVGAIDAEQQAKNKEIYDRLIGEQQNQKMFQSQQNQARFNERDFPLWKGQMQAINSQRMAAQENQSNALENIPYQIGNISQAVTRPSLREKPYPMQQPVNREIGMDSAPALQPTRIGFMPSKTPNQNNPSLAYIKARYGKKFGLPTDYTGIPNYQATNDITNY